MTSPHDTNHITYKFIFVVYSSLVFVGSLHLAGDVAAYYSTSSGEKGVLSIESKAQVWLHARKLETMTRMNGESVRQRLKDVYF